MYLLVKTTANRVKQTGSLFEAVRGHWKLDPNHASQCSHVIVTMDGTKNIHGAFSVDKWYPSTVLDDRFVFSGEQDEQLTNKLLGKQLNSKLCIKGSQNPVQYVDEKDLLQI